MSNDLRQARLDAIAATRAALASDDEGLRILLEGCDEPRGMARAAAGMAASVLSLLPEESRERILNALTAAAFGPDGALP